MRYLKTLLLTLLASVGMVSYAQTWTADAVGEGYYLLYNVGTGQYLTKGNGWGTQASITSDNPLVLEVKLVNGKYFLRTGVNGTNFGLEHLSGGTVYTDQSRNKQSTWTFTEVATDNGPVYNIVSADNHGGGAGAYLTASNENTIVTPAGGAQGDFSNWKVRNVVNGAYLTNVNDAMMAATVGEAVDASDLILNNQFSFVASKFWSMNAGNQNLCGGTATNPCAESWRSTFTLSQVLNVPNGRYQLKAQAALTDYTGAYDGREYPVVYAGNASSPFISMEAGDQGTSMSQLSNAFAAGKYEVTPLTVEVTNGQLTVGVRGTRTDTWCIWDNFRLTYFGNANGLKNLIDKANELVPTLDEQNAAGLQEAIDAAQKVLDNEAATNAEIEEAIAALQEAYENFNKVNIAKQFAYDILTQVPAALYPADFDWNAPRNYKYYKNNEGKYQLASREVVAILIDILNAVENPEEGSEMGLEEAASTLTAYARLVVETHSVGAALGEQGDAGYSEMWEELKASGYDGYKRTFVLYYMYYGMNFFESLSDFYEAFNEYFGSRDEFDANFTAHITNPDLEEGTDGWEVDGFRTLSDQPLSTAVTTYYGDEAEYTYFDQWSANGFKADAHQTIQLPAGRYMLTVAGRGGSNKAFTEIGAQDPDNYFQVYATNNQGVTTMQSIEQIGDGVNSGVFGRGWNDASVFFTMPSTGDVTIGIRAASSSEGWVSATRFRLTRLGDGALYLNENETFATQLDWDAVAYNFGVAPTDLVLNKKMEAGKWYSIALPGDIHYDQIAAQFGEGTMLAQPVGVDDLDVDDKTMKVVDFLQWDATTTYNYYGITTDPVYGQRFDGMMANVPYFIKPTKVNANNRYVFHDVTSLDTKSFYKDGKWSWGAFSVSDDPEEWGYFWTSDYAAIKFYPNYEYKTSFSDGYTLEFNDTVKAFTGYMVTDGAELAYCRLITWGDEGLYYDKDYLDLLLQQIDDALALAKQKADWYPGIPAAITSVLTTEPRLRTDVDAVNAFAAIKSAIAEAKKAYEPSKKFNALKAEAEELLATDHSELVAGADDNFKALLADLQKRFDALTEAAGIDALIDELTAAIAEYKTQIFIAGTLEAGNVIIKNVATGKFFGAANSWGTRSSLVENSELLTLAKLENGKYTLETRYCPNGGTSYFFGTNLFVDNENAAELEITPVGEGVYTIATVDGFLGYDGSASEISNAVDKSSNNALWQVIPVDDVDALFADATIDAPVNATFLIKDANFGRGNRDKDAWTIESEFINGGENYNLEGGANENKCAESWQTKFTLSQEIELPNGVYVLTAQAAVTDYSGAYDTEAMPVIYANDETSTFNAMEEGDQATSMTQLSGSFSAGKYFVKPVVVEVTDGKLTIGAHSDYFIYWSIWDNFGLTAYGDADIAAVRAAVNAAGSTTGIDEVNVDNNNGAIYNLNGVRVNNMSKKGIYIINGKKVAVK